MVKAKILIYEDVTANYVSGLFTILQTGYPEGVVIKKTSAIALAKWILKETKPKKRRKSK
jgi:hypothetical protein